MSTPRVQYCTSVSLLPTLTLRTIDRKYPVIRAIVVLSSAMTGYANNSVEVTVFCVIGDAECEKGGDFSEPSPSLSRRKRQFSLP
jgi:hypothetical protein